MASCVSGRGGGEGGVGWSGLFFAFTNIGFIQRMIYGLYSMYICMYGMLTLIVM